jgi:uncharacterized protein HemY
LEGPAFGAFRFLGSARVRSRARRITAAPSWRWRQVPDAFYRQYTLGLIASAERRWAEADASLQRAVQLDDSAPQVWQSLAAVKQRNGDAAGLPRPAMEGS